MKKKLNIVAYEYIKNKIITNEYKPNQLLQEKELTKELNLSKTPIKKALFKLQDEGFVIINPRKSIFVTDIDLKLIKDVFQVRFKIEPLLVEMTISFLEEEKLKNSLTDFKKQFQNMKSKKNISGMEFDQLYGSYRIFFAQNCGNFFLSKDMTLIYEHLNRIRLVLYGYNNRRLEAIDEHLVIIDLILRNESIDTIKNLCEKHIEAAQIDFFKNLHNLNI